MGLKSFEKFVRDKMRFLTMIALLIAFVFSGIFMIYQSLKDLTDKREILEQLVSSYVKLFSEMVEKKDVLYESFFEYIEKHSNDEGILEKAYEIFNIDPENVSIEPLNENEEFKVGRTYYDHETGKLIKKARITIGEKTFLVKIEEDAKEVSAFLEDMLNRIHSMVFVKDIAVFLGKKSKVLGDLELSERELEYVDSVLGSGADYKIFISDSSLRRFTMLVVISPEKGETVIVKLILNRTRLFLSLIMGPMGFSISFLVAFVIAYRLSQKSGKIVSEPIEHLSNVIKNFDPKKRESPPSLSVDIVEVKNLEEAYRTMADEITEAFSRLEEMNRKLKESYSRFSKQLARIAEHYDEYTGNHIIRVGVLSAQIAYWLGFENDFVEKIKESAPLHDIGKLLVPRDILKKRGMLTDEEYEEMKKHTIYGARILEGIEEFEMAKNIALYHHEKFDGSGYPYGLKNEDIPMEALIVALVDVYDALRSPRPYKRAFSSQEAFRIITEGDGRTVPEHFHPDVLRVFIEHYKELEILWEMVKAGKTEDIIRE